MATGGVGKVPTKSELVGVEDLLWVSSIVMNCFMVLMSMESSVDSALVTGVMVRMGMHGSSTASKKDAVP